MFQRNFNVQHKDGMTACPGCLKFRIFVDDRTEEFLEATTRLELLLLQVILTGQQHKDRGVF